MAGQTYLQVGDTRIELNEHGFVRRTDLWNESVAAVLAASEGVTELTAEHWKVVRYLHRHYLEFRIAPMIRKLCKETRLTLKRIYELFPSGPAKGACKIAGLPDAKGCI